MVQDPASFSNDWTHFAHVFVTATDQRYREIDFIATGTNDIGNLPKMCLGRFLELHAISVHVRDRKHLAPEKILVPHKERVGEQQVGIDRDLQHLFWCHCRPAVFACINQIVDAMHIKHPEHTKPFRLFVTQTERMPDLVQIGKLKPAGLRSRVPGFSRCLWLWNCPA